MLPFWSSFPCVWSRCDTTRACSDCELYFLTLTWLGVTKANTPVTKCGLYQLALALSSCPFTNIFLIMVVLFKGLFFTWLSSLYQAISLSSKVLRSELSCFRRSHSFSSTVWATTSDQSFEIVDFRSCSATCAHCVITTTAPGRCLHQTSVSVY